MRPRTDSELAPATEGGAATLPCATARRISKRLVIHAVTLSMVSLLTIFVFAPSCHAQEPQTLMGMIAQWRYPDSQVSGATLSDAATVNAAGERTLPSIQYKAVLTTKDSVAKVVAYYKAKLVPGAGSATLKPEEVRAADSGESVTFHEDSSGRPVEIRIILINSDKASTTLVISRAVAESETHIAWTRYQKL